MTIEENSLLRAIEKGNGYQWLCEREHELTRWELLDILKEMIYAIRTLDIEKSDYLAEVMDNITSMWGEKIE